MEKNENGIPTRRESTPERMDGGTGGMHITGDGTKQNSPSPTGDGDKTGMQNGAGCTGLGGVLTSGDVSLAYVYAPKQSFCMLYSDTEAMKHGTLFEQLYKPMEVYPR